MITINIQNKRFKGIYSWDDITLSKFMELAAITLPDGYEAYILADGNYDHERKDSIDQYLAVISSLTDKQLKEDYPAYYKRVCLCLSDVPEEYLTSELVLSLYDWYFRPFVYSIIYNAPVISIKGKIVDYTPDYIKSIRIGKETFYFPESIEISGQSFPLAKEWIVTYSDALETVKDMKFRNNLSQLATFMAIYCRKKNEQYDDTKVAERQILFMSAPMSLIWSVFFYIIQRVIYSGILTRLFGELPRSLAADVLVVRTYRNTVQEV
jgi:hypothetical protein